MGFNRYPRYPRYHFFVRIFFKHFFSQTKMKILLCFALCCFLLNYRIESGNTMTLPAGGQDAPKRASVGCKLFWVELCRNAISAPVDKEVDIAPLTKIAAQEDAKPA